MRLQSEGSGNADIKKYYAM